MPRTPAVAVIIWEFAVAPQRRAAFVRAYGPRGSWARLFSRSRGYLGTELLRSGPGRYITLDRWRSMADFHSFKRRYGTAYRALDSTCQRLTASERFLGRGLTISSGKP